MEFRVLGPIEAWLDGSRVRLGGPKQRTLLAALVLRANHVVSTDQLTTWLWGENAPSTATTQLHKYVSQLRGVLGHELIVRHGMGYLLQAERSQIDAAMFDHHVETARALSEAGHVAEAATELRTALGLWRGPALTDGTPDLVDAEGAYLEERRLVARTDRAEADLILGRHDKVVGELQSLVREHPYQERFRAQLMIALYRCGRTSDALAVYDEVREVLAEELGLDPGPELRQLHQSILTEDESLAAAPVTESTVAGTESPPPAQLPPAIGDFSGRDKQVGRIRPWLVSDDGESPERIATTVVAIAGKGGVGKTALAVHSAYLVKAEFPDGQLVVSLQGTGPEPLDARVVLQRFLRALGVDGSAIPDSLDERIELYRTRTAHRRILVLLDDAASEAQIRPLLPGSPGCAVLITSRTRLSGLEGAHFEELEVFESEQAVELFESIVGQERTAAERQVAAEIVQQCGYLPLAVRIAAARLVRRPHWSLARLAARLADERRRLDELVAGDLDVRASLALGCHGLSEPELRAFGLLGLLDAPDFAGWVVGPLLDVAIGEAEDLVEALVEAQLLEVAGVDAAGQTRFRFHDLVRLYARETALRGEPENVRQAALFRTLGVWLTLAESADRRLHGNGARGWSPRESVPSAYYDLDTATVAELVVDPLRWFDAERPALVAAAEQAFTGGTAAPILISQAWAFCHHLTGFFELRGHCDEWERTHRAVLDLCRRSGDHRGEAVTQLGLARLWALRVSIDACLLATARAIKLFRTIEWPAPEAEALVVRCRILPELAQHEEALGLAEWAISLARVAGNSFAEIQAHAEIALINYFRGDYDRAREPLQRSLQLAVECGIRREEAMALRHLAMVSREEGEFAEACRLSESALVAFREIGDRSFRAITLLTLGLSHLQAGSQEARRIIDRACSLFRTLNIELGILESLSVRAHLLLSEGNSAQAVAILEDALRPRRGSRNLHTSAYALRVLGMAYAAERRHQEAGETWRKAREIYLHLGNHTAVRELEIVLAGGKETVAGGKLCGSECP